jgi:tRNA (cytidine/uridine-2'-O-)-methyltransferase
MFHVVLYEPEIPPNTGNIIRLCANTGCTLHLIEPLGFSMSDKQLRRAGLDYSEYADVRVHSGLEAMRQSVPNGAAYLLTTKGTRSVSDVRYEDGDLLIFGPETRGLPDNVLERSDCDHRIRIPMRPGSRSLNLSNAVAITVYEAWRQIGFVGSRA